MSDMDPQELGGGEAMCGLGNPELDTHAAQTLVELNGRRSELPVEDFEVLMDAISLTAFEQRRPPCDEPTTLVEGVQPEGTVDELFATFLNGIPRPSYVSGGHGIIAEGFGIFTFPFGRVGGEDILAQVFRMPVLEEGGGRTVSYQLRRVRTV